MADFRLIEATAIGSAGTPARAPRPARGMTSRYQIVDGRLHHCGKIARRMRADQRACIIRAGLDPHRELRDRFDASMVCRAWLVDGELAALGGVIGAMLSASAFVWLVLTDKATRHPRAIIKEARRQLAAIMVTKKELATLVIPSDTAAVRLAVFLGFHVAHEGRGAPATSRMARAELAAAVIGDPALRIPVGASFGVPMGYHVEGTSQCA